jgi:putative chitinase
LPAPIFKALKNYLMINRERFYETITTKVSNGLVLFPTLLQSQIDGMNAVLDYWEANGFHDGRHLAYIYATVYHETARTMQPIEEYGKGKTRPYGQKQKHSGVKYTNPDKIYYGRGLVQLTWFENYELMTRLLRVDLLANPDLACDMKIAIQIMFEGMMTGSSSFGDFTGKCLEMYFNDDKEDPIGARKIINGTDKAELIATYYWSFKKAILG